MLQDYITSFTTDWRTFLKAPYSVLSSLLTTDRYKMSLLKPSTKALALSCKVSVRTDIRGFLSLQYLVRNDDGQICFVEYYCCPDQEVEEEWQQSSLYIPLWISTLTSVHTGVVLGIEDTVGNSYMYVKHCHWICGKITWPTRSCYIPVCS